MGGGQGHALVRRDWPRGGCWQGSRGWAEVGQGEEAGLATSLEEGQEAVQKGGGVSRMGWKLAGTRGRGGKHDTHLI